MKDNCSVCMSPWTIALSGDSQSKWDETDVHDMQHPQPMYTNENYRSTCFSISCWLRTSLVWNRHSTWESFENTLPTKGAVAIVVPAWRMNLGGTCSFFRVEEVATSNTKVVSITPNVVIFLCFSSAHAPISKSLDSFVTGSHFVFSVCFLRPQAEAQKQCQVAQGMSWSVLWTWRPKRRSGWKQRKRSLPYASANAASFEPNLQDVHPVFVILFYWFALDFICSILADVWTPCSTTAVDSWVRVWVYWESGLLDIAVLADSEWRRSCCHEAALVISTDGRGANQGTLNHNMTRTMRGSRGKGTLAYNSIRNKCCSQLKICFAQYSTFLCFPVRGHPFAER